MTLGQRISRYRKELHISQEELGARLGVSRQAVSKWETDLSAPDMNNLLALAREFGVSVAELTETPEEPVPDAAYVEKPPTPPSNFPQRCKGRLLWIVLGIFLLLILAVLALSASKPSETITPDPIPANEAEAKVPQSDFALILDWTEDGTFLELGDQEGDYPFGTPLS
ncbi:MAG: XRE family transcriptional regulator, partial [Clostridiales bacterium]|nr:XRE family transcriptional regulator [Clostridiales bacterium]